MAFISASDTWNESLHAQSSFLQELQGVKDKHGIWQSYTNHMNGIYQDYYDFIRVAFLLQMRPWNCHRKSDSAYTHASLGGGNHAIPRIPFFKEHLYMNGIWMVYERHISSGGLLLVGSTLLGLPGLPSAPGRFRPGTSDFRQVLFGGAYLACQHKFSWPDNTK